MIPSSLTDADLAGGLKWEALVSSWRGTRYLGDVPVAGGSVTWSTSREVQGSLDLLVPRRMGRDWLPGRDVLHPLACKGQSLAVTIRTSTLVSQRVDIFPVGRFGIAEWQDEGGTIRVSGLSMGQRLVDDGFTSPMSARLGGTLASELRRLIPASIGLRISPLLADRAVPKMSWGDSRMDAIKELLAAWPARMREDGEGNLQVLPPLPDATTPVARLHDGPGGTVVTAYGSDTRQGIHNIVVARGQDMTDSGIPAYQAVAEQSTGPYAVADYGRVVRYFSSPLITSQHACQASADTMLANSIRPASAEPLTMAPDPRLQMDDPVSVVSDGGRTRLGYVSGYQLPLVADSDMRVDVEVVA